MGASSLQPKSRALVPACLADHFWREPIESFLHLGDVFIGVAALAIIEN
jgi:hypothetical protein